MVQQPAGSCEPKHYNKDMKIRVVLADDQALVRGAIAALLGFEEDLEVVGQVGGGVQLLELLALKPADVALVDVEMPGINGLDALEAIRASFPQVAVIMVTAFGRPGYVKRALEAGAKGFIVKDTPASELSAAIRNVYAGQLVVDPQLALAGLSKGDNPLTEREAEVLRAASQGASASEIARELYLSEGTVRNYISAAISKTGAHSRGEAYLRAEENGWL